MRRSMLGVLAGAFVLVIVAIGSGVAGRAGAVRDEQAALEQRSAVASHLLLNSFSRASAIIELAGRNYSFVDYYGAAAYGSRVNRPQNLKPTDEIVERVNRDLAHLGQMYADRIGEAAFVDVTGAENARVMNGRAASREELVRNHRTAPYFQPVFSSSPGVVYQTRPYRGQKTNDWVIAMGTQVLMPDHVRHAMVYFEVTVEGARRQLADAEGYGRLLVIQAGTGAVVMDTARSQRIDMPLGDPADRSFAPLVGGWGERGLVTVDGRQAAYEHVPRTLGNANDWYVVTVAPSAPGPLTGVGWLAPLVLLTALPAIAYAGRALRRGQSALLMAANTDPLTGLGNRRRLAADLAAALPRATAEEPLYLTLSDLDGFKAYNDTLGHPAGDGLLVRLSRALTEALAGRGSAYRIGGDEFCVLFSGRHGSGPQEVFDLVANALHEEGGGLKISASQGLVELPTDATDLTAAMQLVDQRMYEQKRSRRPSDSAEPNGPTAPHPMADRRNLATRPHGVAPTNPEPSALDSHIPAR